MIYPRSTIGTPTPPATRSKLQQVGVLIAHEVGVNTPATGRYRSADPARVLSDARAAAAYGISAGKTWEYNYMIGLDGSIFEQAGVYRAAHCLNFNTQSAGVIFLNATDVPANDNQIAAWWWLRGEMVRLGIIHDNHEVAPHYRYRSTSCPGLRAEPPGASWSGSPTGEGRLGNLIPKLRIAPAVPDPTPPPINHSGYERIAMTNGFEFASATRWDTRGFGNPLNSGEYTCKLDGSTGKIGATVNLTIVGATSAGYASAWKEGALPNTSKVNYPPGGAIANEVSVPLAADGTFKIYISSPAHIIVDLVGYWV